jgi:glycosyltransferase involved in cell wall biosynthesis
LTRHVLIEGWRGISHSYSLVNQHQILALLDRPEVTLSHRDLPYFRAEWTVDKNAAGFEAAAQARVDAVPPPDGRRPDTIYRIGFPPRAYGGDAERIFCFNTLEYLQQPYFYRGEETKRRYPNEAVAIVTPSNWSKAAFVASGMAPERLVVVPHGIDPAAFRPVSPGERVEVRRRMSFAPESFVFLNVGAMTRNKGIVTLLEAFAVINERFPHTRLMLKDQAGLYESRATRSLNEFRLKHPGWALPPVTILSQNVPIRMLRQLYGACDAYVSPYRAEGFNLPPLEAAACGTPIVVTAGGPTDDYAHPSFALKVASKPGFDPEFGGCLEPDLDSLIDCMDRLVTGRAGEIDMQRGAADVHAHHSWARAAERLVAIF